MTDCFLQPNIRFLRAYPIVRYSALPTELHTIFKMVGAVGLAPTKAVRPGDLQSPGVTSFPTHPYFGSPSTDRTYDIFVNSEAQLPLCYRGINWNEEWDLNPRTTVLQTAPLDLSGTLI